MTMREIGVTAVSEAGEDEDVDMDSTAWEDA